jgi:HK97 gp10 family phage protein
MASKGAFSFQLSGVKELTKLLDQLPTVAMRKTVIRNALKKAGQPIAEAAKANVPVVTGQLRDSIKVSTSLIASQRKGRQNRSVVTVYVGSSSPLAHLVEFGTVERILKEPRQVFFNGRWAVIKTTGYTSPNPFLRTAWDSTKRVALKVFAEEMKNELYKSARRLAKRAAAGKLTKRQIEGLSR